MSLQQVSECVTRAFDLWGEICWRHALVAVEVTSPYLTVGIHDKPIDMKMKTSNVVHINVHKDQMKSQPPIPKLTDCDTMNVWFNVTESWVKTSALPLLPRHRELVTELGPIHARLSCENAIAKRQPVYKCNEVQVLTGPPST
ncbi:hypothetical protein ACLOJK_011095 [Asimina triloba]